MCVLFFSCGVGFFSRPAQLPDTVEPGGKVCVCAVFVRLWCGCVFFYALHSYLTQ